METKKPKYNFMKFSSYIGLAAVGIFVFYGFRTGMFSSAENFHKFIVGFGVWSALVFVIIQIISVVVPPLPTSIGGIAGIIAFGPWLGFLYSYIGICIGSVFAFMLSKRFGQKFVKGMAGGKAYDKYISWAGRGKKFDRMFALAIFFPGAPDDLLCYIAGLTEMHLKKFISIIVLGKPMSIAVYSLGLTTAAHYIFSLFK
ncbi:TVP38/TMEM64 family protein [Parasporobacterium paucivorans]|uniref:TVP38/TMEM64 family membrane protein n=1 Tax=Parasporobacterium paucivorans DSM 15970 TaxID=1122934 RepID=A0A1M6D2Z2_9FIRM|nr:TVP38/TMEM64 family protein [Parasporobacterium paucivorans]SHI67549.1 Uncharacterized membrane protein YdjX, TVP38/TMEM64 family, SNARE-associated domain [Parasporobacterium paucivorans DSM 15970]